MNGLCFSIVTYQFTPAIRRALTSLSQNLRKNQHSCGLLLLDKSQGAEVLQWLEQERSIKNTFEQTYLLNIEAIHSLENQNREWLDAAGVDHSRDSIQRARIQMLLATRQFRHELEGSIIWQLDDDMVFEYPETGREFPDVVAEVIDFHKAHPDVDAATGTVFHAPPLPVFLYLEKNLGDLLKCRPIPESLAATGPGYYHDLYPDPPDNGDVQKVVRDAAETEDLFAEILAGNPVFRPIPEVLFTPEAPWHRGGNFIIFNMEVALAFPHLAVQFRGITSRRSDMIHARMLQDAGFRLKGIPVGLYHNRESMGKPDLSRLSQEYLRDTLGAVAVRSLDSLPAAMKRLEEHKAHVQRLREIASAFSHNFPCALALELMNALSSVQQELDKWGGEALSQVLSALKERYLSFLNLYSHEHNHRNHRTE